MYEARSLAIRKKPRIMFDSSFKLFSDMKIGDKGQALISGTITSERQETAEDGTEYIVKTLEIDKFEKIESSIGASRSNRI